MHNITFDKLPEAVSQLLDDVGLIKRLLTTIMDPIHKDNGELRTFDIVIANPPFSQNYTKDNMKFKERFNFWMPTLINMNGRMYDPLIARMLGTDMFTQFPTNLQSFNKYSYCINNPLKYRDKNGEYFFWDDLALILFGGIANVGIQAYEHHIHSFWEGSEYFLVGAASAESTEYLGPYASGVILSAGNTIVQTANGSDGKFETNRIDWGQVAINSGVSLITAGLAENYFGGIAQSASSGISNNFLRGFVNNGIVGAGSGLLTPATNLVINGALGQRLPDYDNNFGSFVGESFLNAFESGVTEGVQGGIQSSLGTGYGNDANPLPDEPQDMETLDPGQITIPDNFNINMNIIPPTPSFIPQQPLFIPQEFSPWGNNFYSPNQ